MQHPLPQNSYPVADCQGLFGVVGDDQAAGAAAGEHGRQLAAQAQADLHIEVGEGFIQQYYRGARGQGPGQGEALALTA